MWASTSERSRAIVAWSLAGAGLLAIGTAVALLGLVLGSIRAMVVALVVLAASYLVAWRAEAIERSPRPGRGR